MDQYAPVEIADMDVLEPGVVQEAAKQKTQVIRMTKSHRPSEMYKRVGSQLTEEGQLILYGCGPLISKCITLSELVRRQSLSKGGQF